MKKIVIAVLAAFPVAVSAQAVTGTLEMVENLSVSAGSNKDLSVARVDASKAFTLTDLRPGNGPQQPYNPPPHANPPGNSNGGHNGNNNGGHPGNNNGGHPGNNNGGHSGNNNGGHNNPPVIIVNPPNPYHPGYHNPGYNNPGYNGPSHETTYPVTSGPMDTTTIIIVASVVVALILLAILI